MSLRPLGRATAAGRYVALAAVLATFALILSAARPAASSVNGLAAFCGRLASTNTGPFPVNAIFASSGAQMVCFGRQRSQAAALKTAGSTSSTSATAPSGTSSGGTKNVDAGDPHEDVSPSGVQAYGQSETSVAATGQYVVEAWNDATALLTLCGPDQMYKEEATGLGFSADGGQSFTDLGGLPNDCESGFVYFGDPSVEAYSAGGTAYFYISSLYVNAGTGESDLALDACTATGTTLTCPPTPTIIATGVPFCDFLDKDFMTVDPVHQRLYISYARFQGCEFDNAGQIELAKCDITTPTTPTCDPGADPLPYFVVSPAGACEQEGAYPAVSSATGDVYVAWEYNWGTSLSRPECATDATHVQERVAYIPFECLTQPTASCPPANEAQVNVTTTEAAFVPGYNRFPMNDFPRIAVSDPYNTVSIVWNDARVHVLGDIFMQSFTQATLTPLQPGPVPLNSLGKGGMHLLPALRNASASGKLTVSWYQRPDANTTLTDVYLNSGIVPIDPNPSQTNSRVTNATSDWGAVSSDIIPNFGDYTDNYVLATPTPPYTDKTLYIAWSDGRLGLPQPFEANVSTP